MVRELTGTTGAGGSDRDPRFSGHTPDASGNKSRILLMPADNCLNLGIDEPIEDFIDLGARNPENIFHTALFKCLNNHIRATLWGLFLIPCRHLKFLIVLFCSVWASSLEVPFRRSAERIPLVLEPQRWRLIEPLHTTCLQLPSLLRSFCFGEIGARIPRQVRFHEVLCLRQRDAIVALTLNLQPQV